MDKNLRYDVTGQRIELTEPVMLVAGTVNVYTVSFSFDSAWDGFQRTAVFFSRDNTTSITADSSRSKSRLHSSCGRFFLSES